MKKLLDWKLCIIYTVVLWAVANLFLKRAAVSENADWRINTMFWMMGALITTLILIPLWLKKYFIKPNKAMTASVIAGVMCSAGIGISSILYQYFDASKIAPILGLATPLSGVVCLLIFKEKLTWKTGLGLVFASLCVYLLG
ncbi:MAG: EamA family transporter [Abditibacteriota bacterium]|nr:EamA family transporter [Abditibacteriota bacterium]